MSPAQGTIHRPVPCLTADPLHEWRGQLPSTNGGKPELRHPASERSDLPQVGLCRRGDDIRRLSEVAARRRASSASIHGRSGAAGSNTATNDSRVAGLTCELLSQAKLLRPRSMRWSHEPMFILTHRKSVLSQNAELPFC